MARGRTQHSPRDKAKAELLTAVDLFRQRNRDRKAALLSCFRQMRRDLQSDIEDLHRAEIAFAEEVDPHMLAIDHSQGSVFMNWAPDVSSFDPRNSLELVAEDLPDDDVSDAKRDIDEALSELDEALEREENEDEEGEEDD